MNYFHTILLYIIITKKAEGLENIVITDIKGQVIKKIKTKDNTVIRVLENEESLQYPGKNFDNLQQINFKWNVYYLCLYKALENMKKRKPIIVRIMEGQHISLKCPFCPRPFQEYEHLEWKYKPLSSDINDPSKPEILDLSSQMKITRKITLKIYNALSGYSGLYVCYNGNNPISMYILEVTKDENITQLSTLPTSNKTVPITKRDKLEIYYEWSKWTKCSVCNNVGKKYKYGTCMVKMKDLKSENFPLVKSFEKSSVRILRQSNNNFGSYLNDMEIAKKTLNKFYTGIPCMSELLPDSIVPFIKTLNMTTVAIADYCMVPCPGPKIFEVMDTEGRIIEKANNSAGIYSTYQAIPKALSKIERRTITANLGANIILQCPGNLNADIPVTWMIDKLILVPEKISQESKERITIDLLNRLHINHLRFKDKRTYSCWQRDKLAGTVKLNIDKRLTFSLDHHFMLLGILAIVVTFLIVGVRILAQRRNIRKK